MTWNGLRRRVGLEKFNKQPHRPVVDMMPDLGKRYAVYMYFVPP